MKAVRTPPFAAATRGGSSIRADTLRIRNLIIDAAGRDRAASSVRADQGPQETCLEGRTFA